MVSKYTVRRLIRKYNINTDVVSEETIKHAIEVELEHRDLIGNSEEHALMIALAHLRESPRYYAMLDRLEKIEQKHWMRHQKPDIFIRTAPFV